MIENGLLTPYAKLLTPCDTCGLSILDGVRAMLNFNVASAGVCDAHLLHVVELHPELEEGIIPDIEPYADERESPCAFAQGVAIWNDIEVAVVRETRTSEEEEQTIRYLIAVTRERLARSVPSA